MINDALFTSARTGTGSDEWGTPKWLYEYLHKQYNFTLDPCASDANHLCEKYYTQETDGLKQVWEGRAYVNPPYSQAKKWMQKAFDSCKDGTAELVVCLIPSRTETTFWQDFVDRRALQVFFVRGRLNFVINGAESENSAPFPSAIVVYHRDAFKLGSLGKTQYSCLDLRSARPKRIPKPRVPRAIPVVETPTVTELADRVERLEDRAREP